MSLLVSFILVLAALVIGEIISTKTKAIIPSVFITAVLFLVGYWTIFPADIIAKAGFSTNIIYLSMYFLITHMGTNCTMENTSYIYIWNLWHLYWYSFTRTTFLFLGYASSCYSATYWRSCCIYNYV